MDNLVTIPSLGFGVGTAWFAGMDHNTDCSPLNENLTLQVINALNVGYNHIDCAEMYGTDREVAQALSSYISSSHVKRTDIWITSKLLKCYDNVRLGATQIIERLNCQYLDLLLLHAPIDFVRDRYSNPNDLKLENIWREMESLVAEGLVRYIGVSNFRASDLKEILSCCRIRPYLNQVEFNPYLQQPKLQEFCRNENILLSAYSPLGPLRLWPGGPIDRVVQELASKYSVSEAAILLRYTSQKGIVPITTTSNENRLVDMISHFQKVDIDSIITDPSDITTDTINNSTENICRSSLWQLTSDEMDRIDNEGAKWTRRKYWVNYLPIDEDSGNI